VEHIRFGPDWTRNVHAIDPAATNAFDQAVQNEEISLDNGGTGGALPHVVWVSAGLANSEHPPYPVNPGESWTRDHITALMNPLGTNPPGPHNVYDHSIVFVVWDDFGGFYDNVSPPNDQVRMSNSEFQGSYQPISGIRVPILCIGPYCKKGVINTELEFGSIMQCLENPPGSPWTLSGRLGGRESLADNNACTAMVNLSQQLIEPPPLPLAGGLMAFDEKLLRALPKPNPDAITLAKDLYRVFFPRKKTQPKRGDSPEPTLPVVNAWMAPSFITRTM
jgi:Phosphoesterase family